MVDKVTVELDNQFLKRFFALTDRIIPEDQEITVLMLNNQLKEVEESVEKAKTDEKELEDLRNKNQKSHFQAGGVLSETAPSSAAETFDDADTPVNQDLNLPKKSILIIDDLGVITYQLGVVLKKIGYETAESREIYDAIEKFKKQKFDLVLMDLFIPTEREGFILLEELKKTAMNKNQKVKIGVMSASGKKEHKQLCKMKGAEFYIEKIDNWQKELLGIVKSVLS